MAMDAKRQAAVQLPTPVTLSYAVIMAPQDCEKRLFYATLLKIYLEYRRAIPVIFFRAISDTGSNSFTVVSYLKINEK